MRKKINIIFLGLTVLFLSKTVARAQVSQVPTFNHIVVVIGENTSSGSVFTNTDAPYINALALTGARFINSFAITHPSQPNYLDLYSGNNQGVTKDSKPKTKFTTKNLGRELIDAGKTYATYSEDLPSVGYDGKSSDGYVRKHNPAANWMGTGTNQVPETTNQPFTAFPTDFNDLPSVSFVIPNLCNDGHDLCAPLNNSVKQYDSWINENLDAYKKWCVANNSLLIITYDEDDKETSLNKIATVFYGAHVAIGTYSQSINHYSVLRMMEDANALTTHAGAAKNASPINFCWTATTAKESTPKSESANGEGERSMATENRTHPNTAVIIYPNPVGDNELIISGVDGDDTDYEIINALGHIVSRGKIVDGKISVSSLLKGIYSLNVTISGRVIVNTFVKN